MESVSREKTLFPMHRVGGTTKSVGSEISTISGRQSNYRRREKQSTICLVFLLIILILLIAAIAVVLVFALSQPRAEEPTEAPDGAVQVSITTSLQQNFTEDLLEESSDAYRQLEEKFRDGMMSLFNNGSLAEYFISLEVNGFRSGSVVVYYTVTLVGLPEDLNTNAEFQALLQVEIQSALNNGNLPGLPADSSTVAVIEINFITTLPQTNQPGGDNSNTAVQCPALSVPANGNIFCTNGNMVDSVCTFNCQNGFSIVGNSELVCQVGGVWPGEPPSCQRVTCPDLGAIPDGVTPSCTNGFFAGSVCIYSCNEGFQIVPETASRTCDPQTGTWSGIQPTCEQVTCPVLNAIANGGPPVCTNGFLAGSVCTYSCNAGFQIERQSASRVCNLQTGTWTGVQPTCEQVMCPSLLPIPNGNLQVCTDSFNSGSVCMYSCNDGFRFETTGSSTCSDTGEWSVPEPSCVQVTCPSLLPIPNGNLQVCTNSFNFGSVCMYSCNDGFRFESTGSRTCSGTGEWSVPEPSCIRVTCPVLGAIPNGAVPSCTDNFFAGSVCTYSCNEGFQIASPNQGASRTCDPQTGSWIGAEPVCEQVPVPANCEQLPDVANAIMQCTDGIAPNSICTYTCNDGWMLASGQDGTRICQVDGTWSNQQPVCEVICGTTPAFIQPRVVNGELSSPGAWPWLASLRTSSGSHQCGGTLIDREWILTAAHCIVDSITMIVLGDLLLNVQTEFHQEFEILPENRFPHPDYNDFSQRNDIALIRLPRPAVYNDFVRPLCLNFNMDEELAFPNNCFVAGWGFTEEDAGVASNELYEAEIPFFDRGVCEQLFFIVGITETQFCAGFTEPGPDACQGDSGGPYMCYDSSSDTWTDVGVVSFGIGCGDGQTPGVYTRISQYMDFITSFITNN